MTYIEQLKIKAKRINYYIHQETEGLPVKASEDLTPDMRKPKYEKLSRKGEYYTISEKYFKTVLRKNHEIDFKIMMKEADKSVKMEKGGTIKTSDGTDGGILKGDSHREGGIDAVVVTDENRPVKLEDKEAIISKKAMESKQLYLFEGHEMTTKQITSKLNENADGNSFFADGGEISDTEQSRSEQEAKDHKQTFEKVESGEIKTAKDLGKSIVDDHEQIKEKEYDGLSSEVNGWDRIPESIKYVTPVKPVKFEKKPSNTNLEKIIAPFTTDDDLRPLMTGIYFDKNGITASDAHRLFHIAGKTKHKGTFYKKTGQKMEGQWPDYEKILPSEYTDFYKADIDLLKFKTYLETVLRANCINPGSQLIVLRYLNQSIGFKLPFLIEIVKALILLGNKKAQIRIYSPSQGVIFVPEKYKDVLNLPGNADFALIMPMTVKGYDAIILKGGTRDIDFKKSLHANYDFKRNVVISNGKTYEINTNLTLTEARELSPISYDKIQFIRKLLSKSQTSIGDSVLIENKDLIANTVDRTIIFNDIDLPNGLYEPEKEYLRKNYLDIDDFPEIEIGKEQLGSSYNQIVLNIDDIKKDEKNVGIGSIGRVGENMYFSFADNSAYQMRKESANIKENITITDVYNKLWIKRFSVYNDISAVLLRTLKEKQIAFNISTTNDYIFISDLDLDLFDEEKEIGSKQLVVNIEDIKEKSLYQRLISGETLSLKDVEGNNMQVKYVIGKLGISKGLQIFQGGKKIKDVSMSKNEIENYLFQFEDTPEAKEIREKTEQAFKKSKYKKILTKIEGFTVLLELADTQTKKDKIQAKIDGFEVLLEME